MCVLVQLGCATLCEEHQHAMQLAVSGGFADREHLALCLRLTLLSLAECSSVILKVQEIALVFSLFSTSTTISRIRVRNKLFDVF